MQPQADRIGLVIRFLWVLAAFAAIFFGLVVVIRQSVLWLRDGVWTEIAVRHAVQWYTGAVSVEAPPLAWVGIQKIFAWSLDAPLSLSAIAAGVMILACTLTSLGAWLCFVGLATYVCVHLSY